MSYCIVDQDGLMLGTETGPFLFDDFSGARVGAAKAQLRIGGVMRFHAERYENHVRMRDTIEIPGEADSPGRSEKGESQ